MRLACLLLLVAQVALSLGGRAAVLCFEADGTVVLEARGDVCCDERAAEPEPTSGAALEATAPADPDCCIDVSLAQALGGERPRAPQVLTAPSDAPVSLTPPLSPALAAARARLSAVAAADPPGARAILAALRSVVIQS